MTVDDEDLPLASNEKQIVQEFDRLFFLFFGSLKSQTRHIYNALFIIFAQLSLMKAEP